MTTPDCVELFFRLPMEQISYVKFVVEAYEGLAQVSSLPGRAEMLWLVPRSQEQEARALANGLAKEAGLVPIPRPTDWPEQVV